jgi:pantoate--beta-alanine ligase
MVLQKMVETEKWPVEIIINPTIREADGLAMSSRNKRLSESERQQSLIIYKAMNSIRENLSPNNLAELKATAKHAIAEEGFEIDYIEITDEALLPIQKWDGKTLLIVLVAASINNIRLIDNLRLN